MKVLVTGNMGYVGPMTVRHLRTRFPDSELTGFDSGFFAHCLTRAEELPEIMLDKQVYGDVREFPPKLLEGIDAVVHLAAVSNDPMGNRFETPTGEINFMASARLAQMARDAGVKHFVFASSCSVYGFAAGGPRKECDELNPLTAYARSKIDTERALADMDLGAMVVTSLRFATACGMSDRLRLDLVLNDFVASAIARREIQVLSDGSPWRPLIEVRDMARAIEWAIQRPMDAGGQYLAVNAGSDGWNYQVAELAQAVAAEIPGTTVSVNTNALPDKRSYRVDFALYRSLAPHHQPCVTLDDCVRQLRDGLRAIGFADEEFRASQAVRLHVLNRYLSEGRLTPDLRWQTRKPIQTPLRAA